VKTSTILTLDLFGNGQAEPESTCSPEGSPVRISPPQAPEPDSTGAGQAYGSSSYVLSVKHYLRGLCLRTHLSSVYEAETQCSKVWRDSTTPRGRMWSALTTPELLTCGNAPSLLQDEGTDFEETPDALCWPTPTVDPFRSRGGDRKHEVGLDRMVKQAWATPRAEGFDAGTHKGRQPDSLHAQMKAWPKPLANDGEKRGNFDISRPQNGLPAAVKRWPTMTASTKTEADMAQAMFAGDDPRRPTYAEARNWPTPVAQSENGGPRPLDGGAAARQHLDEILGAEAAKEMRGQLNPDWVELMMGYPVGWTAVNGLPVREKRRTSTSHRARPTKSPTEASDCEA
jgi:hypothetical protein